MSTTNERLEWHGTSQLDGATTREFTIHASDRPITGVLWSGVDSSPGAPLICFGHGASGDRHQRPIPHIASQLSGKHGCFCLSIDGPVHGRRQVGPGGRASFWPEWRREGSTREMVRDWRLALQVISDQPDVGIGPVGYWGLSMGTIYGAPFVAEEPRVSVAVLGLMGLVSEPTHYKPIIKAAARAITCPVFFIWQLEDELFSRDECLALFDALGSHDKRLHASPGLHPNVPFEELDFSVEFLVSFLNGERPPREVMFKISE
jgi:pimeloyl-ACP methyl ester carboxylesterase